MKVSVDALLTWRSMLVPNCSMYGEWKVGEICTVVCELLEVAPQPWARAALKLV